MSIVKKFIVFVVVVMAATEVWGQAARSPFTTYGVGEAYGNGLVHNQGMGGIGVSQPQMWYLNNQNPALLVYNTLTVFEVGVVAESRTLKGDSLSSKTKGGNMNYLAVAFPIKLTKWTTSLGLMPYTNVDYDFVYSELSDDGVTPIVVNEKGTGGLTQLYWVQWRATHQRDQYRRKGCIHLRSHRRHVFQYASENESSSVHDHCRG
jgi:hypothetical protein